MHYYQFNIGDYRKDTQHLSPMEHYIYRSLLDWHYLDEKPIPKDTTKILRFLRLGNDRLTDVEQVLNDFWTEREDGYIQERVLFEINEYRVKIETASRAGKASAAVRKAKKIKASKQPSNATSTRINARSTTVQPTNNHKPITNNIKPTAHIGESQFRPPSIDDVRGAVQLAGLDIDPDLFFHHFESTGWLINGNPMNNWQARLRVWAKDQAKRNQTRDN